MKRVRRDQLHHQSYGRRLLPSRPSSPVSISIVNSTLWPQLSRMQLAPKGRRREDGRGSPERGGCIQEGEERAGAPGVWGTCLAQRGGSTGHAGKQRITWGERFPPGSLVCLTPSQGTREPGQLLKGTRRNTSQHVWLLVLDTLVKY